VRKLLKTSHFLAFSLGVFVVVACGGRKAPSIIERILDVDTQTLAAEDEKNDLPITVCKEDECYVYLDADVRRIKKYIIAIEERLKACEKK
jgi:hypothetical protein